MSGRRSRDKGKRSELEVCALLRDVFPEIRTKRAGGESASVDRGRDLLGTPGFCVQVKGRAAPNPIGALAEADAGRSQYRREVPVAFVRKIARGTSSRWIVTLYADDFVRMMQLQKALVPPPGTPRRRAIDGLVGED